MPKYKSKAEVIKKLTAARKRLKAAREENPRDENKVQQALRDCNALQRVLDSWDALNS